MATETKEYKMGIQHVRADIVSNSYNEEAGTFDVVFATERAVPAYYWEIGRYNEILSCDPKDVMMERADQGLPVFDCHYPRNAMVQLGVAENIKFSNKQGTATIRLGARADQALRDDLKNGITKGISAGYNVFGLRQEGVMAPGSKETPTYRAVKWEPTEISFAPVQADASARVRSQETDDLHTVTIITNSEREMAEETVIVEQQREQQPPATPEAAPQKVDVAAVRQEATQDQKNRLDAILKSTRAAGLEDAKAIEYFNGSKPIEEIRQEVIETFRKDDPNKGTDGNHSVTTGKEGIDKKREAAEQAILNRIDNKIFGLDKVAGAREFRGLSIYEVAREMMAERGVNTRMLSKEDLAEKIFRTRDMATGDFPLLLENVMNKALRGEYAYVQEFYTMIAKETSVADFKAKALYQVDSTNGMTELPEGDEIKYGKLVEAKQTVSVKSYGEGLRFTRKMFVNDDLSAFESIPNKFVLDWQTIQGDLIWALITAPATMSDNKALFHADHGNLLSGAGSALADAGLTAALKAFKAQTGLDGKRKIRVTPKILVVSPDLEVTARKLLYIGTNPTQPSEVNIWAGAYELIVEPRLSGNAWYLAADPRSIDGLYYAYLNGNSGLRSNREDNFKTDSIDFAVRGEFGCAAIDWRGWLKNAGS